MPETKRKRGRPATIDKQSSMQTVVELFRSKGYTAVSLDDLSDATGLSRPSLYRTFGNKLSMYIGAIDAFGEQVNQTAVPALNNEPDLETAIAKFFLEMLTLYYRDVDIAPGCLVFATAPSSATEAAIQARLNYSIEQLDGLMRARIKRSIPNAAPDTLEQGVDIASNTLIAFSARAKSGASKEDLAEMGARSAKSIVALVSA